MASKIPNAAVLLRCDTFTTILYTLVANMISITAVLETELVEVYDGVLSAACCAELADVAPGVYRRALGPSSDPLGPLIESLLLSLGDEAQEVQYWSRDEWLPLDAHRDVDEEAAVSTGEQRFPRRVWILYLEVEEGMRAPTLIWIPPSRPLPLEVYPNAAPDNLPRDNGIELSLNLLEQSNDGRPSLLFYASATADFRWSHAPTSALEQRSFPGECDSILGA
eukprot:gene9296-11012_t